MYLDIEGLPDTDSYYLIGALIVSEGQETFHTFWADRNHEEPRCSPNSRSHLQVARFPSPAFRGYETVALKRMKERVPESLHPTIDVILEQATNVLSVIHPHIYFPTYSNGLKEIGRFLGFKRADEDATGLHSIVWRKNWNEITIQT